MRNRPRWSAVVLVAMGVGWVPLPTAQAAVRPPAITAQAAVVIDAANGTILYEKNAFLQMDPASTTKIMTALLVIEHGDLNRRVVISQRAHLTGGSSLHLHEREEYTRLDLLKGMLLRSGNDASVALAESDAGSVERFVAEMNVRAQELGAFNTSYENTHGMTRPGHYSSAYDLALITRAALKLPVFQEIVRSQELSIRELTRDAPRTVHNTNQLLYGFAGADGVKTGTTDAAGHCLVASATRQGRQLIAVVLKSAHRFGDASALLDYGFDAYSRVQLAAPGQPLTWRTVRGGRQTSVALVAHQALWVDVPTGQSASLALLAPSMLWAPVDPQRPVGRLVARVEGQPTQIAALYPARPVQARLSNPKRWWRRRGAAPSTAIVGTAFLQ